MQKEQHTNKDKRRLSFGHFINFICLGVFLYAAFQIGDTLYQYWQNRNTLAQAQQIYHEQPTETITKSNKGTVVQIREQFNSLHQINKDIIGWISIDDTSIDYPILQAENNDYYLYRNYERDNTIAGSIFMDYRNNVLTHDRNTVIYGHNMKDGSMFGSLDKYMNEDFFRSHNTIQYDTVYGKYNIEIVSAYETTTDEYYIQTDFHSDEEYLQFVQGIKEKSLYETDTNISAEDKLVTLSTCDSQFHYDKGRFVVIGKFVEQP
ncbi:class B sortase [Pontibacillus litoralis]|uniref:Sortase n=1 Tax=Pontibacillus litoralis JSM 072002 TaxID=1385512 RepID=A0A0A5G576_9BACI|nr:class B sortase [Pontibacillus litoralis]KGX86240.1 sortase [Pontibacillus litoralis JSM 072002]